MLLDMIAAHGRLEMKTFRREKGFRPVIWRAADVVWELSIPRGIDAVQEPGSAELT
jgi:hypothetical protein